MGIFSNFSTLLKSNINDLISRAENPEKMLNQIIMDMNEQLIASKKSVAAAIRRPRRPSPVRPGPTRRWRPCWRCWS